MSDDKRFAGLNEMNRQVGELSGLLRAAADVLECHDFDVRRSLAKTIRDTLAAPTAQGVGE